MAGLRGRRPDGRRRAQRHRNVSTALAAVAVLANAGVASSAEPVEVPTLVARALLPADASAPAPWPAAPDAVPVAAPGATQPVGSLSALVRAGRGTVWAMPDNGFGSKANSASFLLRIYRLRPDFETRRGGSGTIAVEGFVQLSDPWRQVPFPIVTEGTGERLLTGADFDPESLRVDRRGDFWIGDEFGPFLLHADREGRLLEPPVPLPYVASPDNPTVPPGFQANLGRSAGFEAMALAPDRRALLPILEGPLVGDPDQRRRWIYEYDLRRGRYTPRRWQYRVEQPRHLVADAATLDGSQLVVIERDATQGAAAAFKKAFMVDLDVVDREGFVVKREFVDLLHIADPAQISLPAQEGDIGLGDPFAMPYVGPESVLVLRGGRLAVVNDNNFSSRGRNPARIEDSDLIVVQLPAGLPAAAGTSRR